MSGRGIHRLMADTVWYRDVSDRDVYGDPIYGDLRSIKARVEFGAESTSLSGGTVHTPADVVMSLERIPLDARVWLPGDDTRKDEQGRRPQSVGKASTPGGSLTLFKTTFEARTE